MKRIFLFIIVFSLLGTTGFAVEEESFATFSHRLASWADGLQGVIVSAKGAEATIDLGTKSNIVKDMVFDVTKEGEELIHPTTGKSLGKKTIVLGKARVTAVHEKYSDVTYDGKEALKPGYGIKADPPLKAVMAFNGLTDSEKDDASYNILKNEKFKGSKDADYIISCTKERAGAPEIKCALSYRNAEIISVLIPVTEVVITTATNTVKKTNKGDDTGAVYFGDKFISAAIGKPMGDKGDVMVAAALPKAVYIYSYSANNTFKSAYTIKGEFYEIVNIELADLNGNGVDEVFVSNMAKGGKVKSYVYEYNGTEFMPVVSGIDYLFRTYYSNGKKTVICQQFADGDFTGLVMPYTYDGAYSAGEAYKGTEGQRLYGFANTSLGILSFDSAGNLTLKSDDMKTVYDGYFGDTPHKLLYTKTIIVGLTKDTNGNEVNDIRDKTVGVSVYQRMIEVTKGRFLLTGNVPVERKAVGVDVYKNAFVGIYVLLGGEAKPYWSIDNTLPAFIESDIVIDNGEVYILLLKNFKGSFLNEGSSSLRVIKGNME